VRDQKLPSNSHGPRPLHLAKLHQPFTDSVNHFWANPYTSTYYGSRGDRYYNEVTVNVNPAGARYEPIDEKWRLGRRWKNPDDGTEPYFVND
jgi:hypothetical protein